MRQFVTFLSFSACCLLLSACQWVKPTEAGDNVALVKTNHVVDCEKIGATTANVKDRVGFVARKDRKVSEELVVLAKNEAAKLGGDSIVALTEENDGSQTFEVYACQR